MNHPRSREVANVSDAELEQFVKEESDTLPAVVQGPSLVSTRPTAISVEEFARRALFQLTTAQPPFECA